MRYRFATFLLLRPLKKKGNEIKMAWWCWNWNNGGGEEAGRAQKSVFALVARSYWWKLMIGRWSGGIRRHQKQKLPRNPHRLYLEFAGYPWELFGIKQDPKIYKIRWIISSFRDFGGHILRGTGCYNLEDARKQLDEGSMLQEALLWNGKLRR